MKKTTNIIILLLLAIGLGTVLPLAFAPFQFWWIAPLVLAAWQLMIQTQSKRRQFWLSYLLGLSLFTVGLWWIRISINQFGGAPLSLAITLVILLSSYLALYYGALGYLTHKFKLGMICRYLILFPTLGTLLELLRAHLFTGFPWLAMGYTLTPTLFAQELFPAFGALISSFIVYWCAGTIVVLCLALYKATLPKGIGGVLATLSIIVGLTVALNHFYSDAIQENSESINIALVQGNITQDQKFDANRFEDSINTYLALTDRVIEKANLVIWPETAVVAYYDQMSGLMNNLRQWSDYTDTEILLGIPRENAQREQFNSFVHLGAQPTHDQFYDKYRLLPFGEYIPLPDFFGVFYEWVDMPLSGFTKGAVQQSPFTFSQFSTQTTGSICFEAVFGETLRYQAEQSGFLINISNDAWFGNSLAPWQHLQIVQARAIEFARPIARATNTGVTAFIDQHGSIIAQAPLFEATTLSATITGIHGLTTYVKYGDNPWMIGLSGLLILLFLVSIKNSYQHRRKQRR